MRSLRGLHYGGLRIARVVEAEGSLNTVVIAGTQEKYRGLVAKHEDLVATTKVKGGGF
jgi:hypothetical protein